MAPSAQNAPPAPFSDFEYEIARLTEESSCSGHDTQGEAAGLGALFSCVAGPAETAKLFVNGQSGGSGVANVKVMWNAWQEDRGYGVVADRDEARLLAAAAAGLFMPEYREEVVAAFMTGEPREFAGEDFHATVSLTAGPAIDEHLVVFQTNEQVEQQRRARIGSADLFALCKEAIASDLHYAGVLSGDGEPVKETGYQSFFLSGFNRDQFWCEVYPDGRYRIKAAFNAKYPFKYVAQGSF